MALFQPSFVTPDVRSGLGKGVVDATEDLVVSWRINGQSAMTAFSVTICLNDAASTQRYTTGQLTTGCPAYGTSASGEIQFFSCTIAAAALAAAGIANGNEYKIIIQQWWSELDSVTQSSASVFVTRAVPGLSIDAIGTAGVIDTRDYTFTGTYTQAQGDVLNWLRWRIAYADDTAHPFFDSGNISGTMELSCAYDGFFTGAAYAVRLTVQTETGVEADTGWVAFSCSYDTSESHGALTARCAAGTDAVIAEWTGLVFSPGTATGTYSISGGVLTLASGAEAVWDEMNARPLGIEPPWTVVIRGVAQTVSDETAIVTLEMKGGNTLQLRISPPDGMISGMDVHFDWNGTSLYMNPAPSAVENGDFFLMLSTQSFNSSVYGGLNLPTLMYFSSTDRMWESYEGRVLTRDAEAAGITFSDIVSVTVEGPVKVDYIQILQSIGTEQLNGIIGSEYHYAPTWDDPGCGFLCDFTDGTLNSGNAVGGTLTGFSLYRKREDEARLTHVAELPPNVFQAYDYGAVNAALPYVYYLFPNGAEYYQAVVSEPVTPCYWNWTLMECAETDDPNLFTVLAAYRFANNVNTGPMSNNNAPGIFKNFTRYPTVQLAPQNYKSGTLSALIGAVSSVDGQPVYADSIALRDAIFALSTTPNPLFLKNRKGDLLRVKLSEPPTMQTSDATAEQMQTVSLGWVEVGSAAGASLFAGGTAGAVLTGIWISTPPTKTAYFDGETFDPAGMMVMAGFSDGTRMSVMGYTYTPSGVLSYSDTGVTVSYSESSITKTAVQPITVQAVLTSIAITTAPTKTAYEEGETFDPTGMVVTATWSDGTSAAVTGYTCAPSGALGPDVTSITVSYTDGGVTKTAAQAITVEEIPAGTNWATDPWDIIQRTSKNGLTASTYGSQVGQTRTITLTDNTTMTIRLSNATDSMYARSDGSGTTGLCMEFVDCFPDKAQMNATNTNAGGWNACKMHTTTMAQIFALLPSDLAAVIETVNIPTANGGTGTVSVIDSEDKLFLLAEKEVFGTRTYSVAAEANALTQWAWYAQHNTDADRVKKVSGSASFWWLRSPSSGSSNFFCGVISSGSANGSGYANVSSGVSPGFCI